jgi:hypothetical protein
MAINANGGVGSSQYGPSTTLTSTAPKDTIAYFASTGNFSSGPPNATAWDALKDLGLELVAIVILAVVAGLGPSGANFSLGFLILLWLLAILANPSKA